MKIQKRIGILTMGMAAVLALQGVTVCAAESVELTEETVQEQQEQVQLAEEELQEQPEQEAAPLGIVPAEHTPDQILPPEPPEEEITFEAAANGSVSVTDYGAVANDNGDDTDAFNDAIKALGDGGGTVNVPAGTWVIDPTVGVKLKSNTALIMDSNAVLRVAATSEDNYAVIRIRGVVNVRISGGQIDGERDRHVGTNGEWGHGIGIYDSSNVTISSVRVSSNWGDGIYIGTSDDADDLYGCSQVTISGCTITDNRRSNISIVDGNDITIDGCTIANAWGAAPQCGINMEPNATGGRVPDDRICKRIRIMNTTVDVHNGITGDVSGQYFGFMTHYYPDDKSVYTVYDLQISNCSFNGDCGNYSGKKCVISNSTIRGTLYDVYNTQLQNTQCGDLWQDANPYADDGVVPAEDPAVIDEEKVRAFLTRLYWVVMQRGPDEKGMNSWINSLRTNGTGATVARGFFLSPEMMERELSNSDYIDLLYLGMFDREGDAGGKAGWMDMLESGMSHEAVVAGFANSAEFGNLCGRYGIVQGTLSSGQARDQNKGVTKFVARLYTEALGRSYDEAGLNDWCGQILADPSKDNILRISTTGFLNSQEFLNKGLSDEQYVHVMYRTYLGRDEDPDGLNDWRGRLAAGAGRDEIAAGFAGSLEFAGIMAEYGL